MLRNTAMSVPGGAVRHSMTAVAPLSRRAATGRVVRRIPATTVTVFALTLISGGCGRHDTPAALPSTTRPWGPSGPTSVPSSPSATTAEDQVAAAYRAFLDAANKAITAPRGQAHTILMNYATGGFLDFQVRQAGVHQSAHEEPWGRAVVHITGVEISGSDATLHDCQDDANAGLAHQRTRQLIPGSRGIANQNLVANMTRGSDGRWRVAGLRLLQSACRPS